MNARSAVGGCWNVAERETLSQPNQEEQDKEKKHYFDVDSIQRPSLEWLDTSFDRDDTRKHENAQSHRFNEKENEKGQRPESSCTR